MDADVRQAGLELTFTIRCVITAALAGLALQLTHVPAPGFDSSALATSTGYEPLDMLARMTTSIVALAFNPVVTALVIVELFWPLLPGMAKWDTLGLAYSAAQARMLLFLSFVLAMFQAWGVAASLEEVQTAVPLVPEPGDFYRFTYAVTQIAGIAVLAAIANAITRFGIGSGFWVILAVFQLARLPSVIMENYESLQRGQIASASPLVILALVIAAAIAISYLFARGLEQGRSPQQSAADLILPPFLGIALASFLYGLVIVTGSWFLGEGLPPDAFAGHSPVRLLVTAGLILLFALIRCWDNRARGIQIALLTVTIHFALQVLAPVTGIAMGFGADVFVIVTAVLTLAWHQCARRSVSAAH